MSRSVEIISRIFIPAQILASDPSAVFWMNTNAHTREYITAYYIIRKVTSNQIYRVPSTLYVTYFILLLPRSLI